MTVTALGTHTSRKLEVEMCKAVAEQRDWRSGNTEVQLQKNVARQDGSTVSRVFLHGHHIANVYHDFGFVRRELMVIVATLADWPTVTTISRLRALGASIRVHKRVVFLNGKCVAETAARRQSNSVRLPT